MSIDKRNIIKNKRNNNCSSLNMVTTLFFLILFLFGQSVTAFTYLYSNINISKQQNIDDLNDFFSIEVYKLLNYNLTSPLGTDSKDTEPLNENELEENSAKEIYNIDGVSLVSERIRFSSIRSTILNFISDYSSKSKLIPLFVLLHTWKSYLS